MQHSPTRTPEPGATLTIEEAAEFEMLDALPPFDDCGNVAWVFEGEPTTRRERQGHTNFVGTRSTCAMSLCRMACSPRLSH